MFCFSVRDQFFPAHRTVGKIIGFYILMTIVHERWKGKFFFTRAMKAYKGSGIIAPVAVKLITRWRQNCQPHAPATLPLPPPPPLPPATSGRASSIYWILNRRLRGATELVWIVWRREKFCASTGIQTLECPPHSLIIIPSVPEIQVYIFLNWIMTVIS